MGGQALVITWLIVNFAYTSTLRKLVTNANGRTNHKTIHQHLVMNKNIMFQLHARNLLLNPVIMMCDRTHFPLEIFFMIGANDSQ